MKGLTFYVHLHMEVSGLHRIRALRKKRDFWTRKLAHIFEEARGWLHCHTSIWREKVGTSVDGLQVNISEPKRCHAAHRVTLSIRVLRKSSHKKYAYRGTSREVKEARRSHTCSRQCASEEKKHEITGNSLIIVAHTKNKIKYINNSTPFPGVFDAGGC